MIRGIHPGWDPPSHPWLLPRQPRDELTWVGGDALALVHGHIVGLEVRVDGVVLEGPNHLLDGVVDEDEADEGGEALLGEACDVLYNEAGVGCHQDKALQGRVQPNPQAEFHVVDPIASGRGDTQSCEGGQVLGTRPTPVGTGPGVPWGGPTLTC